MNADPKGVLAGVHFIDGDHAACEGALAAGARFAAGYPITPSTEVVERFALRAPTVGGVFIQMEDELAASIAIQGAVWGGMVAPILAYCATTYHLCYAIPMLVGTISAAVSFAIAIALGPETRGRDLAADVVVA